MNKIKIILTMTFGLMLMGSLPSLAEIPASINDLIGLYGPPDYGPSGYGASETSDKIKRRQVPSYGWEFVFLYNDMIIRVNTVDRNINRDTVSKMEFSRDTPFNSLEIGSILQVLSVEEQWKQVDKQNWILPSAKAKAHWNGENKITVQ